MTDDLFAAEEGNTALSREEQLDFISSLSTRAELNEAERANVHATVSRVSIGFKKCIV